MADETEKIIYEVEVDTSKAKKGTEDLGGVVDKLAPKLSGVVSGFQSMKSAALAFIATPIGAVVAALGLAIGALTKYFKGSEEGQDNLTKVVNVGKVAFQLLGKVVEQVGSVIFKTLEFLGGVAEKVVNFISPAAGAALKAVTDAAAAITKLDDDIEARENELITRRAEVNNKIQKLRAEAIEQEGKQKRDTIAEAIKLEQDLAAEQKQQLTDRLKLFDLEHERQRELTEEQKKERAELSAAIINADTESFSNTLRFKKELEKLDDEIEQKQAARFALEVERQNGIKEFQEYQEQKRIEDNARLEEDAAKALERIDARHQAEMELQAQIAADMEASNQAERDEVNKTFEVYKKKTEDELKLEFLKKQNKLSNAATVFSQAASLLEKESVAHKALSIIAASIDTYRAATAALTAGPFIGPILAATTTALGLANVAKIAGFATGGEVSGVIGSNWGLPISRSNGDNVLITAKSGEVILNKQQQSALGGDATFARIGVPGFATGGQVNNPFDTSFVAGQVNQERIQNDLLQSLLLGTQKVLVVEEVEALQVQRLQIRQRASL